jgi:uncharacterized protein with PQ loop repeat
MKSPTGWKKYYTHWMTLWAVIAHSWLVIQATELYRSKDANGLSLAAFIFLSFSGVIWFIYGTFVIEPRSRILMISGAVSFILAVINIVGIALYQKDGDDQSEDLVAE